MENIIYHSNIRDVFINLAIEELLLEHDKNSLCLCFCQNDPAIVIGKNQNPWLEANLNFLKNNNIKLARRISGGGTVYHDSGNLNISLICPKEQYKKDILGRLIMDSLSDIGIISERGEREDIFVNGKKLSGHAFRYKKDRILHHCTLLINSDLQSLKESLKGQENIYNSKSVMSVKSPVLKLVDIQKDITVNVIKDLISKHFENTFGTGKTISIDEDNIFKYFSKELTTGIIKRIQSEEWIYNKTPKFDFTIEENGENLNFSFDKGKITTNQKNYDAKMSDCFTFNKNQPNLDNMASLLAI